MSARLVALLAVLVLSACGTPLDERVEQRDQCEKVGGQWVEWDDPMWGGRYGQCELDKEADR